jgi:phytoene/squalene synthetase
MSRKRSDLSEDLESAYTWCKEYTRNRARNFYYGFSILPEEKRNAIYAA